MPYRATTTCDDALITAREELLAAAAEGRRRLERREAEAERARVLAEEAARIQEQRTALREQRSRTRKRQLRLARSTSRLGLLAATHWWGAWYFIGVMLFANAAAPLLITGSWRLFCCALGLWVLAPPLAWAGARLALGGSQAREQRWHESLPFAVRGYPQCLGVEIKTMQLVLSFRGNPPAPELVRDLAAADDLLDSDGPGSIRVDGRKVILVAPKAGLRRWLDHDNFGYRVWIHRIARTLTRLHAVHPLAVVSVGVTQR